MILNMVLWCFAGILALMCLIVAMRGLGRDTVTVKGRSVALSKRLALTGEHFTPSMGASAILWGMGVLLAYFVASAIYCAVTTDAVSWSGLYYVWKHYDAHHYRVLAEMGYHGYTNEEHLFLVFFPLYPWLVHGLAQVIPSYDLCGHLLSAVCFVGSCYMLARMTTEEFGSRVGKLTLALFSAYPWAFFFAAYYTESLFMLLSLITFYCIRRHRYFLVGVFGALAALTRMQGILLAVVGVVEYVVSDKPQEKLRARMWRGLWHDLWRKLLCIALAGLGIVAYLWLNYSVEGNPFQFTIYQDQHWFQHFVPLPRCLRVIVDYLLSTWPTRVSITTWIPNVAVFTLCLAAAGYGVRRLPPTWMTYFLLVFMMNYSLSWPLSCGRYIASAFPLPVILATASRRRPLLGYFLIVFSVILQGALLFGFLSGKSVY